MTNKATKTKTEAAIDSAFDAHARINPRASLNLSAKVKVSAQKYEALTIVDISETGARLKISASAPPLDHFEIYWIPVAGLPPLLLEGERIWKNEDTYGIKFVNLSPKVMSVLKSFVRFHREETAAQ